MRGTTVVIGLLVVALVGSNAYMMYQVIDVGVTATYREVTLEDHRIALAQALAILPVAAAPEGVP